MPLGAASSNYIQGVELLKGDVGLPAYTRSLTELSDVTIDLFDVNGKQIRNLVTAHRYVPGNYSVALPVDELQNGTYLVRMTAGDKVYTTKVNVAR
jgi:hypothetical protein